MSTASGAIREWTKFGLNTPKHIVNHAHSDWVPFLTVAHVAHVHTALRIIETEFLRAELVSDKGRLRASRARVVWFSPNDWNDGFRYGNVRFSFNRLKLLTGRRIYWVESVAHSPAACQFLITKTEHANLDEYDPSTDNGPWSQQSSGEHVRNGAVTLEIMVEEDVPLAQAIDVDFVKHHPRGCSGDVKPCRYAAMTEYQAAAEFVALAVYRGVNLHLPGFVPQGKARSTLTTAIAYLLRRVDNISQRASWSSVSHSAPVAPALARTILGCLGNPAFEKDLAATAQLFASHRDLEIACLEAIAVAAGVPTSMFDEWL